MCNLYSTRRSVAEVAAHFAIGPGNVAPFNVQAETYPGYPGMVIREINGSRALQSMVWGFPRIEKSKKTGKPLKPRPVNNARDDKLLSFFWKDSFERRRCLIPLTAWAEAEGEAGRMTRTWYSLAGVDLFAVAGIWRPTDEWGDAYSMVMVDGCAQMSDVHDRMPVILRPEAYDTWMRAPADEALAMARTCDDGLAVDRTTELWFKPRTTTEARTLL
jgi:putative SOS response-associated peptidase YedK